MKKTLPELFLGYEVDFIEEILPDGDIRTSIVHKTTSPFYKNGGDNTIFNITSGSSEDNYETIVLNKDYIYEKTMKRIDDFIKENNYPSLEEWDDAIKLHFKMTFI